MTIDKAVLFVQKPGSFLRRAAWRPDLKLRVDYVGLHLTRDDKQPYPLSVADLVADDWHVLVTGE